MKPLSMLVGCSLLVAGSAWAEGGGSAAGAGAGASNVKDPRGGKIEYMKRQPPPSESRVGMYATFIVEKQILSKGATAGMSRLREGLFIPSQWGLEGVGSNRKAIGKDATQVADRALTDLSNSVGEMKLSAQDQGEFLKLYNQVIAETVSQDALKQACAGHKKESYEGTKTSGDEHGECDGAITEYVRAIERLNQKFTRDPKTAMKRCKFTKVSEDSVRCLMMKDARAAAREELQTSPTTSGDGG